MSLECNVQMRQNLVCDGLGCPHPKPKGQSRNLTDLTELYC